MSFENEEYYEQMLEGSASGAFTFPSPPYDSDYVPEPVQRKPKSQPKRARRRSKKSVDVPVLSGMLTPPESPSRVEVSADHLVTTKVQPMAAFDVDEFLNVKDIEYNPKNANADLYYSGSPAKYSKYHAHLMNLFFENTQPNHHVHKQALVECANSKRPAGKITKPSKNLCCQNLENCTRQIQKFRRRLQCQKNSRDHRVKSDVKKIRLMQNANVLSDEIDDLTRSNEQLKAQLCRLTRLLNGTLASTKQLTIMKDLMEV